MRRRRGAGVYLTSSFMMEPHGAFFSKARYRLRWTQDQLARHERTLRRRGFVDVRRAVLTKANVNAEGAIGLTWSGLYEWLGKNGTRSEWAERLRSYLRAAEVRLARENYLTEGTLDDVRRIPILGRQPVYVR